MENVVQMCRAAILQFEKDNKTNFDEQGVIEIIAKEVKNAKTSCRTMKEAAERSLLPKSKGK